MTKKDYELIASVFRASRGHHTPTSIAERLADALKGENPRMDRARFIAACMGEDAKDSAGRVVPYSTDPIAGMRR